MIGGWRVDNIDNSKKISTIPYRKDNGIGRINASGLYCMLVKKELFQSHEFHVSAFGPDVNFGLYISKRGYNNFINWNSCFYFCL